MNNKIDKIIIGVIYDNNLDSEALLNEIEYIRKNTK